jgi:hypothetical protein
MDFISDSHEPSYLAEGGCRYTYEPSPEVAVVGSDGAPEPQRVDRRASVADDRPVES